ncbi:MAG: PrsW family intramembrane metalloprotease [Candidatus Kariarchaeaceae archaeon]
MSVINDWINGPYGWTAILLIVVISTGLTVLFYYTRDKYEPEPYSRILVAYAYGMISVVPAIFISLVAIDFLILSPIISAVILAPIIEEFAKGYFVVRLSKDKSFDGPLDGIIYGAMVGAGFATVENLLYGFVASLVTIEAGVELTFYRSLAQIVGHPLYTGLMGAGVGAHKVGLHKQPYNLIWQSIVLHGMWNGAASLQSNFFFFGLIVVIIISIFRFRNELTQSIRLDKEAFERGYYDQKQAYYDYMQSLYNQHYYGQSDTQYQQTDLYQQFPPKFPQNQERNHQNQKK